LKKWLSSLLAFMLMFSFTMPFQAAAEEAERPTLNYVAFGDSLAAGYLNDGSKGEGYPVYIKTGIESETGYLVNLTNHGVGGFKTTNILTQLEDPTIQQAVSEADFITYDAGANDMLGAILPALLDPVNNPLPTQEEINALLEQVGSNIGTALSTMKALNPDVEIYVMGYYNALYYMMENSFLINEVLAGLNSTIQYAAELTGSHYVPTMAAFEGKYEEYLPNPDIHPTSDGYVAIAGEFLNSILPNLDGIWFYGSGAPTSDIGYNYSLYLDIDTLDVYGKYNGEWLLIANLFDLEGETHEGYGEPDAELGVMGDFYVDLETGAVYVKADNFLWIYIGQVEDEEPGEEPGEGEEPVDTEEPGNEGEQPGDNEEEPGNDGEEGKPLPNTATDQYTILVFGLLVMISSAVIFQLRKRVTH